VVKLLFTRTWEKEDVGTEGRGKNSQECPPKKRAAKDNDATGTRKRLLQRALERETLGDKGRKKVMKGIGGKKQGRTAESRRSAGLLEGQDYEGRHKNIRDISRSGRNEIERPKERYSTKDTWHEGGAEVARLT